MGTTPPTGFLGPQGTRAAEKRGGLGGHGTHEQTKAPEGTLQPAETLCGASREAERERRDFTGPQTPGGKKVAINLVSHRSSQGRLNTGILLEACQRER